MDIRYCGYLYELYSLVSCNRLSAICGSYVEQILANLLTSVLERIRKPLVF